MGINLLDTGRNLNIHKAFKRRPGRLLNVSCTLCIVRKGVQVPAPFKAPTP